MRRLTRLTPVRAARKGSTPPARGFETLGPAVLCSAIERHGLGSERPNGACGPYGEGDRRPNLLQRLFSPLRIGPVELSNRIVSTAHQTGLVHESGTLRAQEVGATSSLERPN